MVCCHEVSDEIGRRRDLLQQIDKRPEFVPVASVGSVIEAASPRLGEWRWCGDTDGALPPRTVLPQVVCTRSIDDWRPIRIQVQAVADPVGPLSGVLEVL